MADPLLDILSQAIPQEKSHLVQFEDSAVYLDHIRALPQTGVSSERAHLQTSLDSIRKTLSSLANNSHKQIITSSTAIDGLVDEYTHFKNAVSEFYNVQLTDTHDATSKLQKEQQHASSAASKRRKSSSSFSSAAAASSALKSSGGGVFYGVGESLSESEGLLILRNLDKIHDILELPSLASACVRNGYYSEALDLCSHVKHLSMRFGSLNIIQSIEKSMEEVMTVMRLQLLALLCENIKLPTQIKVIGYLKRMPASLLLGDSHELADIDASSTGFLQHLYLLSRLSFIRSTYKTLDPLKEPALEKYLKRYIEFFREHVFATITGFHHIFSKSEPLLLKQFLQAAVKDLQNVLQELGPKVTDQSVRSSLWLQLAYCSQSLGRVGGEFWPSLQGSKDSPITDKEWLDTIEKRMEISQRLGSIIH